jgi:hypothetical protein
VYDEEGLQNHCSLRVVEIQDVSQRDKRISQNVEGKEANLSFACKGFKDATGAAEARRKPASFCSATKGDSAVVLLVVLRSAVGGWSTEIDARPDNF